MNICPPAVTRLTVYRRPQSYKLWSENRHESPKPWRDPIPWLKNKPTTSTYCKPTERHTGSRAGVNQNRPTLLLLALSKPGSKEQNHPIPIPPWTNCPYPLSGELWSENRHESPNPLEAGGKPSTWLPSGRLVFASL